MSNDQLTNLLTIILYIMLGILSLLLLIYIALRIHDKSKEKKQANKSKIKHEENNDTSSSKTPIDYSKQSIYSLPSTSQTNAPLPCDNAIGWRV